MSTVQVRQAQRSDEAKIIEAQLAMASESEGLKLDPKVLTLGVRGVFEKPERGTYWIAEVNSEIAGMLLVVKEWSDWRNRDIWWIHSVYTWPEFRGKGVFSGLYNHLKSLIQSDPALGGLRLYVEIENVRAQRVYKKLGMRDDHYYMYEWMKDF